MSVNKDDPGYSDLAFHAQVFVDGIQTLCAVTADEEAGLVVEHDGTANGVDWNTVERHGVVRIVIPDEIK